MKVFFQTNVNNRVAKMYRWVPLSFFAFFFTMCLIIFLPGFEQQEAMLFLIVVMAGYNIGLSMFCIQALARIESG